MLLWSVRNPVCCSSQIPNLRRSLREKHTIIWRVDGTLCSYHVGHNIFQPKKSYAVLWYIVWKWDERFKIRTELNKFESSTHSPASLLPRGQPLNRSLCDWCYRHVPAYFRNSPRTIMRYHASPAIQPRNQPLKVQVIRHKRSSHILEEALSMGS